MNHIRTVAAWLNDLAALTAGNTPLIELEAKIATLTSVIADAFPDPACFSRASLAAISRENNFFPSFGVLHRQLGIWREVNRPRQTGAPSELADAPMPERDRAIVASWYRVGDKTANGLAVVRRYASAGYEWLVRNDLLAADIAVRRGWDEAATPDAVGRQVQSDWKNPDIVSDTACKYVGDSLALGLLRGLVSKWAPENLGLIPE